MLIYIVHCTVIYKIVGYCYGMNLVLLFAAFIVSAFVSYAINKIPLVRALFKI
jgi:hypothetical protein